MRRKISLSRRWRVALTAVIVAVVLGPLLVAEVVHLVRYGHLGLGLHADLLVDRQFHIGVPGISVGYAVRAVNLTPLPILLKPCVGPEEFGPGTLYRYSVERWASETGGWAAVMSFNPGDCTPYPVETRVWWPGQEIYTVTWEATGARVKKGDRVRFRLFTLFDTPDSALFQMTFASPEFVTVDESTNKNGPALRIKH